MRALAVAIGLARGPDAPSRDARRRRGSLVGLAARERFRDVRHAFGSAAIKKLDPNTVQAYMRHAHYSTTQRYLHHKPRPEHARQLEEAFRESNVLPFRDTLGTRPNPRRRP
jgi:integrase